MLPFLLCHLGFFMVVCAQQVPLDPGVSGPALELVHLYHELFPSGVTISASGRKFSNYPSSLDPDNTNYQVAELVSFDEEIPYPNAKINSAPGGPINGTGVSATGANYQNYLIGVVSVVTDAKDRLWILDCGRALTAEGTLVPATYGGAKLIGIDISNNTIFNTIIFPTTVAYPDSNLNDVRFDLRPSITTSGQGIAYITDSSTQGRNGIVIVDLGTGESWRHLDNIPQVRAELQSTFTIWGETVYSIPTWGGSIKRIAFGASGVDGVALSADGDRLYWTAVGSRYLHSIPTSRLRDNGLSSELLAQASITSQSQQGTSDGLESDTNGIIYVGNFEQNAISAFDPVTGLTRVFVRDPRLGWTDSMSVATDGYIYFVENQLWRTPNHYPGVDRRVKPYALFRTRLPNNGSKILLA